MKDNRGMTEIVKTVTSVTEAAIFIYGVNIILYGHLSPGGGFAGGVIVAFLFILFFIAYGKETAFKKMNTSQAHIIESIGFLGIIVLFSLRFFWGAENVFQFFDNIYGGRDFMLFSGGPIVFENMAIALKVGFSVFIAFVFLSIFSREEEK